MKTLALTTAAALMASTAAIAQVETRTVTFENEGAMLSGTLYLPEGHNGAALPTVVVTGAWTSVQKQMPANYAREMAEHGFAAFTFDFRGWGESGDPPASSKARKPRLRTFARLLSSSPLCQKWMLRTSTASASVPRLAT